MLSGTLSLARRMRLQNYSIEATCPMFRWDFICVNLFYFFATSTQPPFYMWTEVPGGGGAVNFITGMGGFLQAKILSWNKLFRTAATRLFFMAILA